MHAQETLQQDFIPFQAKLLYEKSFSSCSVVMKRKRKGKEGKNPLRQNPLHSCRGPGTPDPPLVTRPGQNNVTISITFLPAPSACSTT